MRQGSGGLQVWLADLNALAKVLDELDERERLLSPDERRRPRRFAEDVANELRRSRIALRLLLARAGVADPRAPFATVPRAGKPTLAGGPEFSISHTAGFALIGLCSAGPIGIDLETRRALRLAPEREGLLLAAGATLGVENSTASQDVVAAWVRLEALAKALGSGIGSVLAEIGIAGPAARAPSTQAVAQRTARLVQKADCRVWDLALPGNLLGAAAVPCSIGAAPNVRKLRGQDCGSLGRFARP